MEFGLQFFPDVGPDEKSAQQYWNECLDLVDLCDELGYAQVRTVEHYFEPYGGYSPSPHVFLTAASQRTSKARLLTGAVLPIFNHPLKIAGEIGMLDAISNGRLDCGFGRAFLPHEFQRFDRSMDDSRARFNEGVEAVRRLLEEENVTFNGQFHRFSNVTSLPRPTQKPRPPFWVAALGTPASMEAAGKNGFNLMLVAFAGPQMQEAIGAYREAWQQAEHPGEGKIALGFHMFCHQDREEAHRIAKPNIDAYFKSLVSAAEQDSGGAPVHLPGTTPDTAATLTRYELPASTRCWMAAPSGWALRATYASRSPATLPRWVVSAPPRYRSTSTSSPRPTQRHPCASSPRK